MEECWCLIYIEVYDYSKCVETSNSLISNVLPKSEICNTKLEADHREDYRVNDIVIFGCSLQISILC